MGRVRGEGGWGGPTKSSEEAYLTPDTIESSSIASAIIIILLCGCLWGCEFRGEWSCGSFPPYLDQRTMRRSDPDDASVVRNWEKEKIKGGRALSKDRERGHDRRRAAWGLAVVCWWLVCRQGCPRGGVVCAASVFGPTRSSPALGLASSSAPCDTVVCVCVCVLVERTWSGKKGSTSASLSKGEARQTRRSENSSAVTELIGSHEQTSPDGLEALVACQLMVYLMPDGSDQLQRGPYCEFVWESPLENRKVPAD